MNSIIGIMILTIMVITIIGGLMAVAHMITRFGIKSKDSRDKQIPYECGVVGEESSSSRVHSGFYLIAILFVLFDIEIIFLYPWALAYRDFINDGYGLYYLISLLIFLSIFIIGLFWEIRVQALRWR